MFKTQNFKDGVYQGTTLGSARHGQGCFAWDDGQVYVGGWDHDEMSGLGIFFFHYGGYMVGKFEHCKVNGTAILRLENGVVIMGGFANG